MAEVREFSLKLTGDSKGAEDAVRRLEKALQELEKRQGTQVNVAKETTQAATSSSAALLGLSLAFGAVSTAVTATAAGMKVVFDNLQRGDPIRQVTAAFNELSESAGVLANDRLVKLRAATQGVISDFELMKSANLAKQLQLDVKTFDGMAGAAVRLGEAVGRNATDSINDLTVALGRQSTKILDNLGIILKQKDANEEWAKSHGKTVKSMTDMERRAAFAEVAIRKMNEALAFLGEPADDAGRAYRRLTTDITNAGDAFSQGVVNSEPMKDLLNDISAAIKDIDWADLGEQFADTIAGMARAAAQYAPTIKSAFDFLVMNPARGASYLLGDSEQSKAERLAVEIKRDRWRKSSSEGPRSPLQAVMSLIPKYVGGLGGGWSEADAASLASKEKSFAAMFQQLTTVEGGKGLFGDDIGGTLKRMGRGVLKADSIVGNMLDKGGTDKTAEKAAKQIDRVRDSLAKLTNEAEKSQLSEKIKKALAVGDTATAGALGKQFADLTGEGVKLGLLKGAKLGGPEAAKIAAEAAAIEIEKQSGAALSSIQGKLSDLKFDTAQNKLEEGFEEALKKGNVAAATEIQGKLKQTIYNATLAGQTEAYESGNPAAIKAAEEYAQAVANEYERTAAKKIEEANKEAFRNSVEFYSNLIELAAEGDAKTIENALKSALKRVAIGFAAQMAANVAASMGFAGLGNIGSAQGLGQSLAASLGFGGGGVSKIGELLGSGLTASAVALDGSAAALTAAAAALAGSAKIPGVPGTPPTPVPTPNASPDPGQLSTVMVKSGIIAAVVAAAATAVYAYKEFQSSDKSTGDAAKASGATYAAGDPTGFSQAYFFASSAFGIGGDPKKAAEREAREKILDQLFNGDLNVQTVQGQFGLNTNSVNSSAIGVGPKDIGLANPLAMLFSGGEDKMQGDLANIFAEAINQADNFNESIVNTLSLMDKLGYNADQVKDGLGQLFLDGKISLDEFSNSLSTVNILAQEDLLGPDSINDAFRILAENIDSSPRTALKGLELAFKEMAQAGIDTQEEVLAFVNEKFGPEIGSVFQTLYENGITSWEGVAQAGPDAWNLIFNSLKPVKDLLEEVFGIIEDGDSKVSLDNTNSQVAKIGKTAKSTNEELRKTMELVNSGGARGGSGGGTDPNATTTERRLYRR